MHGTMAMFLAILVTPVLGAESDQAVGVSLMQTRKILGAGGSDDEKLVISGALTSGSNPIDHAHLVCHHEGCAEVKAQLEIINKKIEVVNGKLQECGKRRAQMEQNLKAAAMERAKAEAALKQCGEDRQKLAAGLAKCAKDRAEAEKGLAECGRDRALLEAKLKQCAEVDRPNAEKALAKCAAERAGLEKQLAMIVAKLKKGGSKGGSSIRRRRRRRRSRSLAQVESHEAHEEEDTHHTEDALQGEEDDDTEDISLLSMSEIESRKVAIKQRLEDLKHEEQRFEGELQAVVRETVQAELQSQRNEKKAEDYMNQIGAQDQLEAELSGALDVAESDGKKFEQNLEKLEVDVAAAESAFDRSTADLADATANNAGIMELQLKTQADLIQLIQRARKIQHQRHEELTKKHMKHSHKVKKVEALLEEHEDSLRKRDHEECDDLRAKVIHAKGKLDAASAALAQCLQAKKDIQAKIDKVDALKDIAAKGLEQCLQTKARLKASLDECHHRRDAAREKLKECLSRKVELKSKIELCHAKRDEARKKLAQCLENKKMLNEKIAKAKANLAQKPQVRLIEVENGSGATDTADDIEEVLDALREANGNFDELAEEDLDIGKVIKSALEEIQSTSAEDKTIREALEEAELLEVKSQEDMMLLQTTLEDAYKSLTGIDYKANEAESELAASGAEADQATQQLSSLLQSLRTGLIQ